MEELEFNLQDFETDADKANALMVYLVNRAAAFNADNFDSIYIEFLDMPCSHVAWHICSMIAMYKNIPIYTNKISKTARFYRKNKVIKPVSSRKVKKLKQDKRTLILDGLTACDDTEEAYGFPYPQIFYGFSNDTLFFIAMHLYGWDYDKKAYKKAHKVVKPKKIKKVKAENDA
jgi:hypothetical protein